MSDAEMINGIPASNYRRCSRCGKAFDSRKACAARIKTVHKGKGERVPVMTKDHPDHPDYEQSEWEILRDARGQQ